MSQPTVGEVINLTDHKEALAEYEEALSDGCAWLEEVDRSVGSIAISLAIVGEWRAEFGDAAIGTVATVSEDELSSVSDPRVTALRELQLHVRDVLSLLSLGRTA